MHIFMFSIMQGYINILNEQLLFYVFWKITQNCMIPY